MFGVYYYLDENKNCVPCSVEEYSRKFESDKKRVAYDEVKEKRISTVFLGIDHQFVDNGTPLLFETMIFPLDSFMDEYCERYSTWQEAEEGHKKVLQAVINGELPEQP